MTYRWALRPVDRPDVVAQLQRELNDLPEALARALVLRGVNTFDDARLFFRPSLDHVHDPFLMQDMHAAAARVAEAVERRERVLVYGDYDVDGTTATALVTAFLRSRGVEADFFIPDRIEDGYGLGTTGIDKAADTGAALIIALDCGITAHEAADYARSRGLDLVICDHHTAHETVPDAVAVLDPKRKDDAYPFKELSGCALGFKLVQATLQTMGQDPAEALPYLDLVAVSTASDIVPLYGENRVLMAEGLRRLRTAPRLGLRVLAQTAGLDLQTATTRDIVFTIGPRINAAGRLGDAGRAVELMLAEDEATAAELAEHLEAVNRRRRAIDDETGEAARQQAERQITARTRHALVLHHDDWHPGVVGIVASRIVERFYRPTIMLCTVGDVIKGSARSIAGINVYDALSDCDDLLVTFGGHDYAAGLALAPDDLDAFRERFDAAVGERVTPELLTPVMDVDAELDLGAVDARFWAVLKQFAPFGPENLAPTFHARGLALAGEPRTVGRGGAHLKCSVRQHGAAHAPFDVIGFGLGHHLDLLQTCRRQGRPFEMLFSLEENHWNGRTTLQLRARDVRV